MSSNRTQLTFRAAVIAAVFAPANTPRAIIDKLNAEVVAAVREPGISKRLTDLGLEVVASSPSELDQFIASETAPKPEEQQRTVTQTTQCRGAIASCHGVCDTSIQNGVQACQIFNLQRSCLSRLVRMERAYPFE